MNEMSGANSTVGTIVLDTGLFEDRATATAALLHLNLAEKDWHKLMPDKMNDGDWDEIVSLVLSAKRVITV